MKNRAAVAGIGAAGAATGLATNIVYQARKKRLEEKLEQELGDSKKKTAATEAYNLAKTIAPGGMVPARYLGERGMGTIDPELQERRLSYGVKRDYFNKKTMALTNPTWGNRRKLKRFERNANRIGVPLKKWDQQYNDMTMQSNPFVDPARSRTATLGRKGEALGAGLGLVAGAAIGAAMFKNKVPKSVQREVVKVVAEAPKMVPQVKGVAGVVRELGMVPVGLLGALGRLPGQMISGTVKGVGKAVTPKSAFRAGVQGGVLGMGTGVVGGRVMGEVAEQLVKRPDIPGWDPNQPTVPELLGMAAHSKAQKLLEE
jgi:hypothetical protein